MHAMTMTLDATPAARAHERTIGLWLLACCGVLLALVMLGGATRLTESGLSIVDWRPVTGVLPPIGDVQWQAEFDKYRQSPQYVKVNQGMALDDFKLIFWYEYGHRLLARFLGLVFALPLLWFWLRGMIPSQLKRPLVGVLALGALQGWMGWYMVSSGLVDIPRVSHYRLAAHLSLALAIFGAMFWIAVRTLWPARPGAAPRARAGWWLLALAALTILWGAFVAGLRAGYMFNTFPTMGGHWIPPGMGTFEPAWLNLIENPVAVQFIHRLLALSLVGCVLALWWRGRREADPALRTAQHWLLAAVLLQATLGISTLLLHVPVWLGTLHQGGAVVLLSALLWWLSRGGPRAA